MVNVNKLKAKMVENEINVDEISDMIGIDRATFYRRLANNGETFSIKEADMIISALNLTKDEVNSIFFSQIDA